MLGRDEGYCPNCRNIVKQENETEYGIFCDKCGADFWFSEVLTDEDVNKWSLQELRNYGGRA